MTRRGMGVHVRSRARCAAPGAGGASVDAEQGLSVPGRGLVPWAAAARAAVRAGPWTTADAAAAAAPAAAARDARGAPWSARPRRLPSPAAHTAYVTSRHTLQAVSEYTLTDLGCSVHVRAGAGLQPRVGRLLREERRRLAYGGSVRHEVRRAAARRAWSGRACGAGRAAAPRAARTALGSARAADAGAPCAARHARHARHAPAAHRPRCHRPSCQPRRRRPTRSPSRRQRQGGPGRPQQAARATRGIRSVAVPT